MIEERSEGRTGIRHLRFVVPAGASSRGPASGWAGAARSPWFSSDANRHEALDLGGPSRKDADLLREIYGTGP